MRRDVLGKGDVGVARLGRRAAIWAVDALKLLVGHRGEEIIGIAGAAEVIARNSHPPDAQVLPAFRLRIETRRLTWLESPHLLLAALVIFAVVRNAQRGRSGSVPVGEQDRQRTKARRKRSGRRETALRLPILARRPIKQVLRTGSPRLVIRPVDIRAEGKRWPFLALLEGRRE